MAEEEKIPKKEEPEEEEEEYSREPFHDVIVRKIPRSIIEKFKSLPILKKIALVILIIASIGAVSVSAVIVSNLLSGVTEITGLSISIVSPPLLPDQSTLETDYTNTLRIYNPTGAAYTGVFTMNFTASRGNLESAHFEIYVDLNRNGVFDAGEKFTCTVITSTKVRCASPSASIASGTTDYPVKIRFKSGLPVPNTLSWQLYIEAS